jgi:hypothetical protein
MSSAEPFVVAKVVERRACEIRSFHEILDVIRVAHPRWRKRRDGWS